VLGELLRVPLDQTGFGSCALCRCRGSGSGSTRHKRLPGRSR
jgi:hypothetical protein